MPREVTPNQGRSGRCVADWGTTDFCLESVRSSGRSDRTVNLYGGGRRTGEQPNCPSTCEVYSTEAPAPRVTSRCWVQKRGTIRIFGYFPYFGEGSNEHLRAGSVGRKDSVKDGV